MPGGGDTLEITGNDPVLGSVTFYCKSGEDTTVNVGGRLTDDSDTQIDTGGNLIVSQRVIPWTVKVTGAMDMMNPQRQEMEKLHSFTATGNSQDWTFNFINGSIYSGNGKIVGAIEGSVKDCTISITFMGGGTLAQL